MFPDMAKNNHQDFAIDPEFLRTILICTLDCVDENGINPKEGAGSQIGDLLIQGALKF